MENELERRVTNLLMMFKVQPDIIGFEYLRLAVIMCYKDSGLQKHISKLVYPLVAERCGATAETVERGIRTAIENCFNCGGLLEINEKCGFVVYNNSFKWTNGEAIAALCELLKIEEGRTKLNEIKQKCKAK